MNVQFSKNFKQAAKVADRCEELNLQFNPDRLSFIMDVLAADGVNENQSLDYDRWLEADDFNFLHDASGIHNCLNRQTGELDNHFLPRFSCEVA